MTIRWPSLLLVLGVVGTTALALRPGPRPTEAVTADPSVIVPVAEPEAAPSAPGVALPLVTESTAKPHRVPPKPKLDSVEPWDGEDLAPQIALAMQERGHFEVDREDPWNAGTLYPAQPNVDPGLDDGNPWARGASYTPRPIAHKPRTKTLGTEDPWATGPVVTADRGAKTAPAEDPPADLHL